MLEHYVLEREQRAHVQAVTWWKVKSGQGGHPARSTVLKA
jgi:hypothetical protein